MQERALDQLDADELYHLALQASQNNNHDDAIVMLKRSIELKPDARTQYILSAEHAEIGMYERAAEEMRKATEMDPSLTTAYLQLGLLHSMLGQNEDAIAAWQPLLALEENDPLQLFGKGLTAVTENNLETARDALSLGIKNNTMNPALNKDMQSVLNTVNQTLGLSESSSLSEEEESDQGKENRKVNPLFLSSYDSNEEH